MPELHTKIWPPSLRFFNSVLLHFPPPLQLVHNQDTSIVHKQKKTAIVYAPWTFLKKILLPGEGVPEAGCNHKGGPASRSRDLQRKGHLEQRYFWTKLYFVENLRKHERAWSYRRRQSSKYSSASSLHFQTMELAWLGLHCQKRFSCFMYIFWRIYHTFACTVTLKNEYKSSD